MGSATRERAKSNQHSAKVIARKPASPAEGGLSEKETLEATVFPVVAIGASAGGLEAYTEFFHALPSDTGMAFVLVQHLDPSHHSILAEILARATRMPVEEVKPKAKIRHNHVYVIPAGASMSIADGSLMLTPRRKGPGQHAPINIFMRSLAQERKSGAIGVILSGTGTDGTSGMEDIKAEGGITFVQEPASAKYDGMPGSAIDSGCVDFILRPRDIAREIARIRICFRRSKPRSNQARNSPTLLPTYPNRKAAFLSSWTNCGRQAVWISANTSRIPSTDARCVAW